MQKKEVEESEEWIRESKLARLYANGHFPGKNKWSIAANSWFTTAKVAAMKGTDKFRSSEWK